jgi:dihydrofolate reductase
MEEVHMRGLIAMEFMSLDGVVQAPIYPDEDQSGGFRHGGWHAPFLDEVAMKWLLAGVTQAGGFLFGRRTYEAFAAYWPKAPAEEQALAAPMNALPKYVATRAPQLPAVWHNSNIITGGLAEGVARLKSENGNDLLVIGSAETVQSLLVSDLVDELRLMIDPVFLGGGKRFYRDDGVKRSLRLAASEVTSTGVILATYSRANG